MTILQSMLGRPAHVLSNKTTQKDYTADREVTVVGAFAGGLLRDKAYFTVMFQWATYSRKHFFTYPASWLSFPPG